METAIITAVSLAVASSGFFAVFRHKKRIMTLDNLSRLFLYMSEKIRVSHMPLMKIYESFDSPFLDKSGFSADLGSYGLSAALSHLDIDADLKEKLVTLGKEIGSKNALYASGLCTDASRMLECRLDRMKKEYPDKKKLWIGLSVSFGLMIFIICI